MEESGPATRRQPWRSGPLRRRSAQRCRPGKASRPPDADHCGVGSRSRRHPAMRESRSRSRPLCFRTDEAATPAWRGAPDDLLGGALTGVPPLRPGLTAPSTRGRSRVGPRPGRPKAECRPRQGLPPPSGQPPSRERRRGTGTGTATATRTATGREAPLLSRYPDVDITWTSRSTPRRVPHRRGGTSRQPLSPARRDEEAAHLRDDLPAALRVSTRAPRANLGRGLRVGARGTRQQQRETEELWSAQA